MLRALAPILSLALLAQPAPYQKAPKAIQAVLDAPGTPSLILSPKGDRFLLAEFDRHPSIKDLAQPMARLAGHRFNPRTRGPHAPPRLKALAMQRLDGPPKTIALPAGVSLGQPRWSPDGTRFALIGASARATELWIGEAATGKLHRIQGLQLNAILGSPLDWMPDGSLLCKALPAGQGLEPSAPEAPQGPRIQENEGKAAPAPTYQDLLQNAQDEARFEFLGQSQLVRVDPATGALRPLGKPGLYANVQPSPDGCLVLVSRLQRPFSFLVPSQQFPVREEVWDGSGALLHLVADQPLAEDIPLEGVRTGPRRLHWRPTEPATLAWVEAMDGGNPKQKAAFRDRILTQAAPFTAKPTELLQLQARLMGMEWGERGDLAVIREYDQDRRWTRTWLLNPARPAEARLAFDLSRNDRYRDPGAFQSRLLPNGHVALRQLAGSLLLVGQGATPEGDRPFLDRFDPATLKTERRFQSDPRRYEAMVALLPDGRFITRRESSTEAPNYVLHGTEAKALTAFADPLPELRKIQKQLVKYTRPDGVTLSFTMYLPPDYKAGERRPAVIWAYPLEFTDASTAGQVTGSANRFTTIGGMSHLFFLLSGYVVLDNATMPVVGDPKTVNDTFLDQVVASAKAAIDKADELGVIDPKRVGVGGHSYGAFMTANLLAHSSLFRAGIARSGAYNRTLTPFGFQSERRTLWEAPEMYLKVSPFMSANHFNAPILLIHGEADNNSGTFPIQSERLYAALKGHGQTARYVTLPLESHGYVARESIEHTLWEMLRWFDRHVKPAKDAPN
ncbi:MAG: prolyl oligopeptidase family serine peptidase [Geothrix sp.]|uniref:S9 family peptidase n=1 Tax=Geothrix sp. TaxID=1962974 RepID=UPI0017D26440|nr:prolyl oligopeptidase family serine peptidase [Geothrix sp.]NWJ40578.1 prolyl oligopeptidase family serine peptidase [Geothrix sp.]WIL21417.1 MAG: prolyl oligopeptidase family serine peptidase [Geothrix sp.]